MLLGAAVRFATLGLQSYEPDEAVTVTLLRQDLGSMLAATPASESTPPLYYLAAWLWSQALGTSEVALRSLSALAGTAFVYVAYRVTLRLVSRRAALIVAALTAVNPFLVWYAQEARAYALVALLCALSLWACVVVRARPSGRGFALWALASAASLATHYFALFPVAAEAVWLLAAAGRDTRLLAAVAGVGIAGGALLPLAIEQEANRSFASLLDASGSLAKRVAQIPKQFLLGYDGPAELALGLVACALAALAVAKWWRERAAPEVARLGALVFGVPVVLALAGFDLVIARNFIVVWLPLAIVVGAGAAVGRAAPAFAAGLCLLGAVALVAQAVYPAYQREDWRGAARALGREGQPRAVLVRGPGTFTSLLPYRPGLRALRAGGEAVREIAVVTVSADSIGVRRRRLPALTLLTADLAGQLALLPPGR